jgi:hypothetical protein
VAFLSATSKARLAVLIGVSVAGATAVIGVFRGAS